MYESYYQLDSNPFSLTPDPHFCFRHRGHRQAREYLEYALNLGEGMVMVTGRPGTGKTTLVESFITGMRTGAVVAVHIAAAQLDPDDLLRAVAYAFDIDAEGQDRATLRFRIRRYLEALHEKGKRALVIVDEAQGLPYAALDELRLLTDLQIESQQLLQLFLVGQEQLHELLAKPEMDFFQQRVIASYQLVPLDLQEARDYIEYRLTRAGWEGRPAFTGAAVRDIHQYTAGVPRHINKLCNRLLLLGYGKGCQTIGHREVRTIAEEMGSEWLQPVEMQRVANGGVAMAAGSKPAQSRNDLDKLAIRRKQRANMSVVRSNTTDEAQPTTEAANCDDMETPAEQDIQSAPEQNIQVPEQDIQAVPESAAVAIPAAKPNEARRVRLHPRAGQALLVLLAGGLVFAGLNRTPSTPDAQPTRMTEPMPPLTAARDAAPGITGIETTAAVALPQAAGDTRPATAAAVETNESAVAISPAPVEANASLAGIDDLEAPSAVDHPQSGKVEETIARVSLPRVADESLPAPDVAVGTNEPTVAMQPVPSEVPPAPTSDVLLADAAINGTNNETTDATTDTGTPPLETAAPASPAEELQGLLAAGHEAFADHRLLMPPKDSAYHYFRGALRLAPGNREATQGIEQIVQRYIELSTRLLEEQNEPMARRFINRGLRIQPDNATLLALREQSIAPPAPEPVSPEPVKVEPVAPAPVAAPAPVVDDKPFFSRMKDFISEQGRVETAGVAGDPKSSSFVYE